MVLKLFELRRGIKLKIKRIGICFNPYKEEFIGSFDKIRNLIENSGFEIVFSCDTTVISDNCSRKDDIDLLLAFGGDGTILKAFHLVDFNVPVVGINFGKLGFLTHYHPEDIEGLLFEINKGNYEFIDFPIYEVRNENNDEKFFGINDVVISKANLKILDISLRVGTYELGRIPADGIVISTQLGSTAYNLSNGGAIISFECGKVFEVSFIAPHIMTARPIVLNDEEIKVSTHQKGANSYLIIDGVKSKLLFPEEMVSIKYSSKTAKLLSINKKNFFELLVQKIGWGKR